MTAIVLEGISRGFPVAGMVLNRLNLTVEQGEFLVIVGPSGSGKTTTLRTIAGLETPDAGRILLGGRDVTARPSHDRDIAMVFQDLALWPHFSVRKNIAFGLRVRSSKSRWRSLLGRFARRPAEVRPMSEPIAERVNWAAKFVGIAGLLDRNVNQLSGGERQRVAIARAVARRPRVFLFDEPLSNLDARLRIELRGELRALHRKLGTTVVYVTHDQAEAMTLGTRIAVMDRGVIRQIGSPREIYDRPADWTVARFLGPAPMNLWNGRIQRDEAGRLAFHCGNLSLDITSHAPAVNVGRPLSLGVRPQAIRATRLVSEIESTSARVCDIEFLGDRAFLHLSGSPEMLAMAAEPRSIELGAPMRAEIDLSGCNWFDGETGARLPEPA